MHGRVRVHSARPMNVLCSFSAWRAAILLLALASSLCAGVLTTSSPAPAGQRTVLEEALAPEIAFRYDYDFPMSLQDAPGEYSMHEYRFGAPLPPVLTDTFILLSSVNYRLFDADVSTETFRDNLELHTLRLPIEAAWLSPTSPWMAVTYVEPGLSTDFNGVNADSFDLTAGVGLGYRFSDDFVLALGAAYSRNYGDDEVFPAIALLWRASDHFVLTVSPDGVMPEWRVNDDWRMKLKFDFLGGRWTVEDPEGQARILRLQGGSLNLLLEHRVFEQCWFTVGAGFNTLAELRIEDGSGGLLLDSDLDEALVLRGGMKWVF